MFNPIKKSKKILGMNSRNLEFIRPLNLKKARLLADDKLLSKKVLAKNDIAVPKLIAKIGSHEELENFDWSSLPPSFALKPSRGFGGEGIIVAYGKRKNEDVWIRADRSLLTVSDLKNHIRNILDGFYSLSNTPDIAFFEERLKLSKVFKPFSFKGIPDIRVIVYNKVPVMAMLRLPTKESGGKANLQQGALGVGIDMASGTTTTAVQGKSKIVEYIPKTRLLLSGIKIPYWQEILRLSVRCQEVSNLGFLGVDIAVDKERGPVVVELNARPGLSIQIANLAGLKERLDRVKGIKIKTLERGIRVGTDLFGGGVEETVEGLSGRKVIGTVEKVKIIGKDEKEIEIEAKIDTGALSTSIDKELAKRLGFEKLLEEFEKIDTSNYELLPENESAIKKDFMEKYGNKIPDLFNIAVVFSSSGSSIRPIIKLNLALEGLSLASYCNIANRQDLQYRVIIGRRNLGRFLIDVNK